MTRLILSIIILCLASTDAWAQAERRSMLRTALLYEQCKTSEKPDLCREKVVRVDAAISAYKMARTDEALRQIKTELEKAEKDLQTSFPDLKFIWS